MKLTIRAGLLARLSHDTAYCATADFPHCLNYDCYRRYRCGKKGNDENAFTPSSIPNHKHYVCPPKHLLFVLPHNLLVLLS